MGAGIQKLKAFQFLSEAHALYQSIGFSEIDPYSDNSMQGYQSAQALGTYRANAVFMELQLTGPKGS